MPHVTQLLLIGLCAQRAAKGAEIEPHTADSGKFRVLRRPEGSELSLGLLEERRMRAAN